MTDLLHPKLSLTPEFYVYTHVSEDGRVLYIGKGKARRAWHYKTRDAAHKAWIDEQSHEYVEIVEQNLTELDAFRLESRMLASGEYSPTYNIQQRQT